MNIAQSNVFTRKGLDVCYELPITFTQALVGCNVIVPTLSGKISLKIPEQIKNGKTFRLKGKGIVDPNTAEIGESA